jgi:hypothetical protein
MNESNLPLLKCAKCKWIGDVTQSATKADELGLPWDVCPLCFSEINIDNSALSEPKVSKIVFSIAEDDSDNYYTANGVSFSKEDDLVGIFTEITADFDQAALCTFLAGAYPLVYGEAVNLMIKEGYEPEGIEEDRDELERLWSEDLFYALCKYQLSSLSYFSDQFSSGTPEADSMLQEVCDFINK